MCSACCQGHMVHPHMLLKTWCVCVCVCVCVCWWWNCMVMNVFFEECFLKRYDSTWAAQGWIRPARLELHLVAYRNATYQWLSFSLLLCNKRQQAFKNLWPDKTHPIGEFYSLDVTPCYSLKVQFTQNENSVIIYSPSCCSNPEFTFFGWTIHLNPLNPLKISTNETIVDIH